LETLVTLNSLRAGGPDERDALALGRVGDAVEEVQFAVSGDDVR
jgi:hypothetical protein